MVLPVPGRHPAGRGPAHHRPQCLPQLEWVKAESRGVKVYWDKEKIEIETPKQAILRIDGENRLLMPGSYTFPREPK